jgi:hypothetical protein
LEIAGTFGFTTRALSESANERTPLILLCERVPALAAASILIQSVIGDGLESSSCCGSELEFYEAECHCHLSDTQDFTRIYSTLGLGKGTLYSTNSSHSWYANSNVTLDTIATLQAFRKRHSEAQRIHAQAASQPTTVDVEHYRSVLKNKAVVDEAQKLLSGFKPVTYDVNAHIRAIETFEVKAVSFPP